MPKIATPMDFTSIAPNFVRDQFEHLTDMKAVVTCDDGHISYCVDTGKRYEFKSSNTLDTTYGKWREIPLGGATNVANVMPEDDDEYALPANNTNYALGSISALDFSNRMPLMVLGCTIRFTASADFTITLPYEFTYNDGNEDVTDTPDYDVRISGSETLDCITDAEYMITIISQGSINVFSMTELKEPENNIESFVSTE